MRFYARDALFYTAEKASFGPGSACFCAANGSGRNQEASRFGEMRCR